MSAKPKCTCCGGNGYTQIRKQHGSVTMVHVKPCRLNCKGWRHAKK